MGKIIFGIIVAICVAGFVVSGVALYNLFHSQQIVPGIILAAMNVLCAIWCGTTMSESWEELQQNH